jgi:hypothetical protein
MPMRLDSLQILESLLVKEFRACQTIYSLTRAERQALANSDISRLFELAREKEMVLDRVSVLETTRMKHLRSLDQRYKNNTPDQEAQILAALLARVRPEDAERLRMLQQGILTLTAQVQDLTRGNHALAAYALEHAEELRTALGEYGQADLPALFAAILAARDALSAGDRGEVSKALESMETALERLGKNLSNELAEPLPATQPAEEPRTTVSAPQRSLSMVEAVANLYRQEAAYRAVLNVNRRIMVVGV